jgi:hypothetical protein
MPVSGRRGVVETATSRWKLGFMRRSGRARIASGSKVRWKT